MPKRALECSRKLPSVEEVNARRLLKNEKQRMAYRKKSGICVDDGSANLASSSSVDDIARPATACVARSSCSKRPRLSLVDCVPIRPSVLPVVSACKHCKAFRFAYEPSGFCCGDGQVSIVVNDFPDELYDLYHGSSEYALHFQKYVRTYNNMFAFTSFGVTKYDKELANSRGTGVYTFKVQGQVFHYLNPLIPSDGSPRHLQLYFYDPSNEIEHRRSIHDYFEPLIIEKLMSVVSVNPYCRFFRSLSNLPNLADKTIVIRTDSKLDQRVYNKPVVDDVASIWVEGRNCEQIRGPDIRVYGKSNESHRVWYHYACYDPLQYPLLFPNGEPGWHSLVERRMRKGGNNVRKEPAVLRPSEHLTVDSLLVEESRVLDSAQRDRSMYVSMREYYSYLLQMRPPLFNIFLSARRLFQQFVVDMCVKIETQRLDYYRFNGEFLRTEIYENLVNALASGETSTSRVGKRHILPASFIGGPRDLRRRYLDAMCLVSTYGKPDLFLTMTCNPDWPEIQNNLYTGQKVHDRPDLVARVFRAKIEQLKNDLFKKNLFGSVAAYVYVVEFQKRGLPHLHVLLILEESWKLKTVTDYDRFVSAEIPDVVRQSYLHSVVAKHMMHGPCGDLNKQSPCMVDGKSCRSRYPKPYQEYTERGDNEYVLYRRRRDGRYVTARGKRLDNAWVVPYNPYLLAKYNCHINVEVCSTIRAVKYLYKYIYKGPDKVAFNVSDVNGESLVDEISNYEMGRWICPQEACWRIFGFRMYGMRPPVLSLDLHLEKQNVVTYRSGNMLDNVVDSDMSQRTMLTEFFRLAATDPFVKAMKLLYEDIPRYFMWNVPSKEWGKRKCQMSIGRINNAHPLEGERFYLRMLLKNIPCPTSFDYLHSYEGCTYSSYKEAAQARGIVNADNIIEKTMEEAVLFRMPCELRLLFASLLATCSVDNPALIWNMFKASMCEDLVCRGLLSVEQAEHKCLVIISAALESVGRNIVTYKLVPDISGIINQHVNKEFDEESAITVEHADLMSIELLNIGQRKAFDSVMHKVDSGGGGAFFIDGPGGTGKTFLYRALLAKIRSTDGIALATASSGVAASLLPGGRTAHSRFKIPTDVGNCLSCNVSKQSGLARLIKSASLIIWDEACMADRVAIEMVDKLLQDLHENKLLFGGKVIVFGGDFRQVLPVVRGANKEATIDACLVRSYIWPLLEKLYLTENMRAVLDPSFASFLMRIGDGIEVVNDVGDVVIPESMQIVGCDLQESINMLVDFVFPDLFSAAQVHGSVFDNAILTPKNCTVDELNDLLISRFSGDLKIYRSFDETIDPAKQEEYIDVLHALSPSGMPPHELKLKLNCPVMLMRNINPSQGLCNGTRLICREFTPNIIVCEVAVGDRKGQRAFIHRIPLLPDDDKTYAVPFKRTQFPLRPSFAMTINKAQGQTLEKVGLYLPNPVFSHGQLYVALSRAKLSSHVRVLTAHAFDDGRLHGLTSNIVYSDLLAMTRDNS